MVHKIRRTWTLEDELCKRPRDGPIVGEKLKDMFFTLSSVSEMADVLRRFYPRFDKKRFVKLVFDDEFEGRELKSKMRHTAQCLGQVLPKPYKKAVDILRKAAPNVTGFQAMCLPDYVELYGLDEWDLSLEALAVLTKYASSEFAIRPYIVKAPKRAMAFMKKLAKDKDPNVRRFASEGCRPRLPWAMAIPAFKRDPGPILPILEALKDDDSEFVRRSVANNLNDISKDHPDLVLDLCSRWQGKSDRTDGIIKHACRTMLKAGDSRAMLLFGFGDPKQIDIKNLKLDKKKLGIGDKVEFTFTVAVRTRKACKVRLEYIVYFARTGPKTSKKVFQISERSIAPGEHAVTKRHSFADMSTRKHKPGKHQIAIIVNGVEKARSEVMLISG